MGMKYRLVVGVVTVIAYTMIVAYVVRWVVSHH